MVAGLLCAAAGRARSRAAAGLAGWGALVVGAALAGAAAHVYEVAVVVEGRTDGAAYVDGLTRAVNNGAAFAAWTGWLVGLVVAVAARPTRAAVPVPASDAGRRPAVPGAGAGAAAGVGPAGRIAEPPPPWWAPTQAGSGDAAVRPGPSAFPPGGMTRTGPAAPVPRSIGHAHPVVTDATYEMTTVSGDPHPSDPDATRPIGLSRHPGPATGGPQAGSGADDDPDATQTLDGPDGTETFPHED
jgi:hypothetical protein